MSRRTHRNPARGRSAAEYQRQTARSGQNERCAHEQLGRVAAPVFRDPSPAGSERGVAFHRFLILALFLGSHAKQCLESAELEDQIHRAERQSRGGEAEQ
jgi:hypothetical protein